MPLNKAFFLAAGMRSKYVVKVTVNSEKYGVLLDKTYLLKVGERVTVCPTVLDGDLLPPNINRKLSFEVAPSREIQGWVSVGEENASWVISLSMNPRAQTKITFDAYVLIGG